MTSRETLAGIRFGFGLSPGQSVTADVSALLGDAKNAARRPKGENLATRAKLLRELQEARQKARDGGAEDKQPEQEIRQLAGRDMRRMLSDAVDGSGFGERLVLFWADHFTVSAGNQRLRVLVPEFVQSAIRPHVAGRFSDMLDAVMTHPAMLLYLDQVNSVGPNSTVGKRRERGLNENLARESLELHTLGVDAGYTQNDVRNLALLLTGLSADREGFKYRAGIAEPGMHTLLGREYGGRPKTLENVRKALVDVARHERTATHIATKLVTHFVGEPLNNDLVTAVAKAFRNSDGNLTATYQALLTHDAAWTAHLAKAKPPIDFLVSALRAGGLSKLDIDSLSIRDIRNGLIQPLREMGQTPFSPPGPDGWSEDPNDWITPPLLAARIRWAGKFAEHIAPNHDPRAFIETTLGDAATDKLRFAVEGAESRIEGIALTLISPEFNRR